MIILEVAISGISSKIPMMMAAWSENTGIFVK